MSKVEQVKALRLARADKSRGGRASKGSGGTVVQGDGDGAARVQAGRAPKAPAAGVAPGPRDTELHTAVTAYLAEVDNPVPDYALRRALRDKLRALVGAPPAPVRPKDKPWVAEGISERTWYRRRNRA